jgi:hypothetical protein
MGGNGDVPTGIMSPISIILQGGLNLDPFSIIGGLGVFGGLNGGPGMIEGLFDEDVPAVGINGLLSGLGLSGKLGEIGDRAGFGSPKNDLIRAAPIAGSIMGNMFAPGIGGPIGSAAGSAGAAMMLGNIGTDKPGYWDNYVNGVGNIEYIS